MRLARNVLAVMTAAAFVIVGAYAIFIPGGFVVVRDSALQVIHACADLAVAFNDALLTH